MSTAGSTPQLPQVGAVTMVPLAAFCSAAAKAWRRPAAVPAPAGSPAHAAAHRITRLALHIQAARRECRLPQPVLDLGAHGVPDGLQKVPDLRPPPFSSHVFAQRYTASGSIARSQQTNFLGTRRLAPTTRGPSITISPPPMDSTRMDANFSLPAGGGKVQACSDGADRRDPSGENDLRRGRGKNLTPAPVGAMADAGQS